MSATKGLKIARPVLSRTPEEARRRVMNLYRAWYRQIPFLLKDYGFTSVTASESELRHKLREEFMKHKDVKDIRVIDLLVHRVNSFHYKLIFRVKTNFWRLPICGVLIPMSWISFEKPSPKSQKTFLENFLVDSRLGGCTSTKLQ